MENRITNEYLNIASKSKRFFAFLIDSFIIQVLFFSYIYYVENTTLWEYFDRDLDIYSTLLSALMSFCYGAIVYPFFSGNIGHKILGLQVIDIENNRNFNKFHEGGCREFVKYAATILLIPHLLLFFNKRNQNFYDRFLNTIVIDKNQYKK